MNRIDKLAELMEQELPSYFPRSEADKFTHGLIKSATLANLEKAKCGPPIVYVGKKACYLKDEFVKWIREYYGNMTLDNNYARKETAHDGTAEPIETDS